MRWLGLWWLWVRAGKGTAFLVCRLRGHRYGPERYLDPVTLAAMPQCSRCSFVRLP